jgi:hypothetical protein
VARLEEACASAVRMGGEAVGSGCIGEDPALDQFMEAYCEMLIKYEQELSKPLKEAMLFLQRIEVQLKNLTLSSSSDNIGDNTLSLSLSNNLNILIFIVYLTDYASMHVFVWWLSLLFFY